ncbi:LOW QUALITY PROTEIN: intercellular adhesion molecule 4 [Dipodomys spectabilis]|uniref:LOW QUALITY PROTEIN: intercellular adhesion molecule 4 n=1 Tax=Dipodomys spectabilis TaxID=105255 RepID=UPI001C53E30E|nr:LOW QUALITY PROTEIN: intercellular adhesion molecule 4 [Dipodomys spectabilis]
MDHSYVVRGHSQSLFLCPLSSPGLRFCGSLFCWRPPTRERGAASGIRGTPRGGVSPSAASGPSVPFWVRLTPKLAEVPPGASVWLNCSHSCPLPATSSLRTRLKRGPALEGPGWVRYQLLEVRAWSSSAVCLVTCAGHTRQATARINAYKRPRSVILEPPVLEGRQYTLRCHVTHVFPVGFLVVSLRRGGRLIYSESLERFQGPDLANVTLTHVVPARPHDFWQRWTCHARLNLDGLVIQSNSAPVTLLFLAQSRTSTALASTSIVVVVGIFLGVGVVSLCKCRAMHPRAETGVF